MMGLLSTKWIAAIAVAVALTTVLAFGAHRYDEGFAAGRRSEQAKAALALRAANERIAAAESRSAAAEAEAGRARVAAVADALLQIKSAKAGGACVLTVEEAKAMSRVR